MSEALRASRPLTRYWPLAAFLAMATLLGIGLTLNPREIPSPLLGKPIPQFDLPPVKGRALGLSSANLKGEVSVVNVFASWCTECRAEHPVWVAFAGEGLAPLHGLNYKDKSDEAAAWLAELGDPYLRTGADLDGKVGIDWGVYGVPETFVVDKRGVIRDKIIGPVSQKIVDERLVPVLKRLQAEPS